MKYVIIGNGVASVAAIEGIRSRDAKGSITVLGREPVSTYGRPLISYYLAGKIGPDRLAYRPEAFYEKHRVEQRLGVMVTAIDRKAKKAVTAGGEEIPYDRLLLATGGNPVWLDIPGLEGPDVYTFTTLADAEALSGAVETAERAVIVGAGLIALKAAEGLAARGVDVTLAVRSRIMRAYFDQAAGDMLVDHLRAKGINFLFGASPKAVLRDADGRVAAVDTDKGRADCDLVVMAAGVRPAKGLAEEAGIGTARGVLADGRLRTSDPDVYAAGDVAEAGDMLTGEPAVIPIWPNAYAQGRRAGENMAGADKAYPGTLSMNSISYFGLPTQSVGMVNPPEGDQDYEVHADRDGEKGTYRKLVFKGGRLVGYVLIGAIDASGLYTSFVKFGFPVDEAIKAKLTAGEPGVLLWPEEFFDKAWNPSSGDLALGIMDRMQGLAK